MKFIFKIIVFVSFTFSGIMNAQEIQLCKAWRIDYSVKNGKKEFLNEEDRNNKMIFYSDNKFLGSEEEIAISGKWKLDKRKKNIIVSSDEFPIDLVFKIILLNDKSLIIEANDGEGSMKRIFMIPAI